MKKGLLSAAFAYVLWGFFPIYFKAMHSIPALQVTSHRVFWSFFFVMILVALRKELGMLRTEANRRTILVYLVAGALLSINWLTYVWAVEAGYVIESSLGYFITPLISMLLGVVFLRERLRPLQWVPVGLATLGVLYLTFSYGRLPWIGLVLALSFGFYGLIKKKAPLGALHGLTFETGAMFLPAFGYLLFAQVSGVGAFGNLGWGPSLLMASTGVVTAIPLLLFATGAKDVPLTMMGILQYIAPTLQFLIGALLYREPFNASNLVGFSIIWTALLVFTIENIIYRRSLRERPLALPK